MEYLIKTINEYQAEIQKNESLLSDIRIEMNKTIDSYKLLVGEPLVHLSKHVTAGMIQLRWRLPGSQKYIELYDTKSPYVKNSIEICFNKYDIFYFEAKRLSLNHDYAMAFNARKRSKRSKDIAKQGMMLRQRYKSRG